MVILNRRAPTDGLAPGQRLFRLSCHLAHPTWGDSTRGFYGRVMANAAAQMLRNAEPLVVGVDIAEEALMLDWLVRDRAGTDGLEWA